MGLTRKAKILIVDDDAVTRLVLRKMLAAEPDWEVIESVNGAAAWRLLESGHQVDLCIADIQMPELDGLGLLRKIRSSEALKSLKVILCTTQRDRETIQSASTLSIDYYIVKPFKKDLVLERVRQGLHQSPAPEKPVQGPSTQPDLTTFLQRAESPPSFPSIYHELVQAVQRSDSSLSEVSEIILQDPSLTSRLLRLANSAFFGSSSEINTVEAAAQLVGLEQLQELVMATSLIESFKNLPSHLVDVARFWEHSMACGVASALLAEYLHDPMPERLFIGGLLHDIGRLTMFLNAPDQSRLILERCEREGQISSKVEREVLGFDHAMLGAELLSSWGLPKSLSEIVRRHHHPPKTSLISQDVFIVHLADFITSALQFGNSGELYIDPLILPDNSEGPLLEACHMDTLISDFESRCECVIPAILQCGTTGPKGSPGLSAPPANASAAKESTDSNEMTLLSVHRLQTGMELACDVPAAGGGILLSKGTQLSTQHLTALRRCDIDAVNVTNNSCHERAFPAEVMQAAEAWVTKKFKHVTGTSPIIASIKNRAILRAAAQCAGQAQDA